MSIEPNLADEEIAPARAKKKRLLLLGVLILLVLLFCCVSVLFLRYVQKPEPLPEMIPFIEEVDYPPHYLFSIYGVDQPIGVSVSPDGERVYVAETGGEHTVKIFSRNGDLLNTIVPPNTSAGERAPANIAVDAQGRVFVSERLQAAILVYDSEGNYLDTLLGPDLSLREYLTKHVGDLPEGSTFYYNGFRLDEGVYYQIPDEPEQVLPPPNPAVWAPLGLRFDDNGNFWITDVMGDDHRIRMISAETIGASTWQDFSPDEFILNPSEEDGEQFTFPNSAVVDNQGRVYVADSNNWRISVWDDKNFLYEFGGGSGENALNLPRGVWLDSKERLHVVDAVSHDVKVYDVSGDQPFFLYVFGGLGIDDGLFHYPNDICIDSTGRLYITDRENNRVQVWSY